MSSPQQKICRQGKSLQRLLRPRRGFFIFLIFLVLSGFFWLSTALNGYYDYEIELPVVVRGMPINLIQTSDSLEVVRVAVHDKGFALLQYVRGKNMSALEIDFPAFRKTDGRCVVSAAELHKLITDKLQNSTTINSIKPDKIELDFVEGVAKTVDVKLIGDFFPASNYYLEHAETRPAQVTLYAPADEMDSIAYAYTERLQVKNFSDTVSCDVRIKALPGMKTVPNTVTAILYPDVLTEEETEVPIETVNVPEGTILRIFPSRVKVRYTVGVSAYRNINVSQFRIYADYDNIEENAEHCRIKLVQVPKGVKRASLTVDEVDYLIEN